MNTLKRKRMKINDMIMLMAALALLSCRKEAGTDTVRDDQVNFKTESLTSGDCFAVNSEGLDKDFYCTKFSVSEDGAATPKDGTAYRFKGTDGASFMAWFPSSAAFSEGKVTFSAEADQSSPSALHDSDFMTACTDVHRSSSQPVALTFSHRMAKLQVVLDGFDAAAVKLRSACLGISWETGTNRVFSEEDGAAVPVSLCRTGEGCFQSMLPAQKLDVTASEENPFITVTTEAAGRSTGIRPPS